MNYYDYAIRIIKAAQDGKALERNFPLDNGWKANSDIRSWNIDALNNPDMIRIKPKFKRVPIEVKDLPPICHVRFLENDAVSYLITKRNTKLNQFNVNGGTKNWMVSQLGDSPEYSADLVTWHKFYKEVEV